VLGPKLEVSRGDLNRTSLTLQTIRLPSQAERLAWLAQQLSHAAGHGIIYTLTVRDANQVADWLKTRGFNVEAYTGETGDRREELEQALLNNKVKALGCDDSAGHGLRQAGSGIRHPLPDARLGRRLLPASRAVLGERWTPPMACCSAARRDRTSPTGLSEARSQPVKKSPMSWSS
jgi:hypothetical protein